MVKVQPILYGTTKKKNDILLKHLINLLYKYGIREYQC